MSHTLNPPWTGSSRPADVHCNLQGWMTMIHTVHLYTANTLRLLFQFWAFVNHRQQGWQRYPCVYQLEAICPAWVLHWCRLLHEWLTPDGTDKRGHPAPPPSLSPLHLSAAQPKIQELTPAACEGCAIPFQVVGARWASLDIKQCVPWEQLPMNQQLYANLVLPKTRFHWIILIIYMWITYECIIMMMMMMIIHYFGS